MAVDLITIGTGNVSGTYYPTVGAICQLVNGYRQKTHLYCSAEATNGSVENLKRLQTGDLVFGIAQTDVLYHAYQGNAEFANNKPYKNVRAVMAINPEVLALVVKKTSEIKVLQDIKGKKISLGNKDSGTMATASTLLKAADIDLLDLTQIQMSSRKAPQALADNTIDGYFYMVGHPASNLKEASLLSDINLIMLDGKPVYDMIEQFPYYSQETISQQYYPALDEDIDSIGVRALLVTDVNTPDATVKLIIRAVLENFNQFQKLYPRHAHLQKTDLVQDLIIPLHPAALVYYKALGLYK